MKKGTLWKVLLIAALAVGLALFARTQTVRADNPTYYVYIDNHYLGEGGSNTGLYYVQKTQKVTNDSSSDWNAYYAPSSGKLYLRNYEGNRIVLLQAHGSKPLVIVLEGTNHISTTDQFGITISTNVGIELDIHASTSGGSLTIDVVNYEASYCAGIEHSRSANSAETTFVQGTAALTIHAEGKRSYGIRSGGTVNVMESASADVSVTYNEEAIGYSAAVYTTDGNLDVSTSGGVSFAAVARDSFANSGYGYAFYSEKTNKKFNCDVKSFPYVSLSSLGKNASVSNLDSVTQKDNYNSNLRFTTKKTHYTETVLLMYYTNKGTPIVGATFPDPSFRALVETFDENNNGYLSQLEIDEITEIHVTNEDAYDWCNDAYSLVGIEYLTGLYILEWDLDIHDTGICPGNFMELDLQNNQDLSSVTVRGGCLRELYVKGLPILSWLDCAHNQLNDLDLSDLPRLTNLLMGSNWLTSINLSKLTALEYLDISANELTTVDLSKLTKLQYLYCADNKLSSLDVSKLARLTDLYCGGNPFTSLTLTNNTKLQWLTCTNSKLTSLNLSKNTALKSVDVSHSKDLTSLTPGINSNIEWLRLIGCDSLASINISRCTKLKKTVTNKKGITEDGVTYIQYATYDDYNEPVYSIVANLGLVLFYETPKAQEVKSGTDATFTCKAAGNGTVSYQWQYLIPGESSWKNVSAASGKKSSYTLTTAPRHDGYQYRCKVTNMYGKSVYSSKVTLRVLGILTPPSAISTLPGKTVKFTVKATGTDLVYQWQFKKPGETTWQNVAAESGKTASYSLKAEARHDGYTYRCRVKNAAGTVWSKTAVLTIIVTPEITQQPKSISTTAGKTAAFTVKATGGALSYQWYYKKPGETTWQKVSASSGKTASYSLTVEARHNGYQYRCKITNAAGSVTSVTVTLTVK